MADSRNKGASFEREVAKLLVLELGMGITFKRDLRQYQTSGHGDLIPSDPAFPFELELKRYAKGPISGTDKWWQQVTTAAARTHKRPALIYKYDRQPIRVVVELQGIRCNISFEDFCYLARETMAHDANY
jgi:Holliday junction resolvase